MSCEVKIFAQIPDLKIVQDYFGFALDESWLNAVYYSISPTGETLVFAHGCKLVILNSHQWLTNQIQHKYTISFKGELENQNEIITNIIALPIYGLGVNSGADWTCIAVGLASGLVLFYTDSGIQIFSQRWHNEPVQTIKAQSGYNLPEEIYIGYQSCMCILQGQQIITLLKSLKQNLNKNFNKPIMNSIPDTVPCRKWEYRQRSGGTINDAVVVGTQQISSFDHYLEQSLEKGFFSKSRSAPVQNNLVIGVGVKPYAGFYYGNEGFIQPDLGDVAKAVATKVLSSLPNWLYKSNTVNVEEQQQIIQPGEQMQCKFGICDIQRQAFNICLSPGNKFAAIADNLHRVILVDCNRGIALRIWKGYRDAQCAFIRVKEKTLKTNKAKKRKALFLVIYSPRMSCIEIWTLQNGPKVAAFSLSKNGQLSFNNYGLLGINPNSKPKFNINACLFLDPSDDTLKEIIIPFHCALSDSNSKTAKDVHLLRRMKTFLRADLDDDSKLEEIVQEFENLCNNLQTDDIRLQCLEMLAKNKRVKPILFQAACVALKNSANSGLDNVELNEGQYPERLLNISNSHLLILLKNYEKLVEFYIGIQNAEGLIENIKNPYKKLKLSEMDLQTIQNLYNLLKAQKNLNYDITGERNQKVTFHEKQQQHGDFVDYLSIFKVDSEHIEINDKKTQLFGFIGENLFREFLDHGENLSAFLEITNRNLLSCDNLITLVLYYWLERPFVYSNCGEIVEDMERLAIVIQHICNLAGEYSQYDYNSISPWWQDIRELLLESPSALRGLFAAMVCRSVSVQHQLKEESYDGEDDNNWEQVSQEAAQWSLLIGKLDDVSILGLILSLPITSSNPKTPTIGYDKPDCSLKAILCDGGKGIVSELVAKWLVNSKLDPSMLGSSVDEMKTDENKETEILDVDPVLVNLNHLRNHFPFSLETGVLLTQMAWEFFSYWSKNLTEIEYLKAGVSCLESFQKIDFALKSGLCCMIWNAHLKIPLEGIKKIIQKVGKLPNNRLCQQDIGLSVSLVPEVLELCLEFLKHFESSINFDERELRYEEILQDGQVPLAFLALQQNHGINVILKLHIELVKVLHLIAYFQLKYSKPITTLFDAMSNQTFFIEINRELNYILPPADQVLNKYREEFLCRLVSASMDLIREDLERLYVLEHQTYINQIEELADLWQCDKIVIKKHQVVEMYAHSWDAYAEELLESSFDNESIGPLLLEIAGRRLNLYASNSQAIFCQVASVGPQLLNYLDNLKLKKPDIPIIAERPDEIELEPLIQLAGKAFKLLSTKESKALHIAGQLFDACSLLKIVENKIR